VLCFPVVFASIAGGLSLVALAIDLAMFYIAKARIDAVQGASATIGISVWLTLAGWILCGLTACCYGVGSCCCGSGARANRSSGDPKGGGYNHDYDRAGSSSYHGHGNGSGSGPDRMRLDALRDEELRKKEQGLPNFATLETVPLTARDDDDAVGGGHHHMPGALRRDGSVVNGVGVGYGRRTGGGATPVNDPYAGYGYNGNGNANGINPWDPNAGYAGHGGLAAPQAARRLSGSDMTNAGQAGLGAGGGGVEQPGVGYGYYGQSQGHGQGQCE
jgi:hypothetical protein